MISRIFTLVQAVVFIAVMAIAGSVAWFFAWPDIAALKKENPAKTSFMKYREEEWQSAGRKVKIDWRWVPASRISPYLRTAVIIAEDDKFWNHAGFDFEAMKKAAEKDIKAKKFKAGGSTISQQLVKNLYLSPSKNPTRKLKEAILTYRMENTLSKKRILEIYLNVIEWGDGVFGAEAAARRYFGKSAADLDAGEAARLAVVLPNPRKLNPLRQDGYVKKRADTIYEIMVKRGYVAEEE
ncbi:MAG: monofunctional biosynthetic peptidoglycan transglycosylase [Nitrospinae bacterium]|nr:monofunctional biosynthetic peptidoglycan transglycosylase [Nitrospinota bacterium]